MNWETGEGLIGCDDPEEVDAAFDRGEPHVGAVVIGLALNCPDVDVVAPRAIRAISSGRHELRGQGLTALSHMVRLTNQADSASVALLRPLLRDPKMREVAENYAADLWTYVPHRDLPAWLHRWSYMYLLRHKIAIWWWSITRRG
ncbi:hypothetical protein [Nonomuraea jabiensis]|uniref:HEAT repeat domain-containing protein n=1 Tax=Nonomuraea jabiensis TaxID=882448 RepID=A0A7W9L7R0_9ACTN|nr:hypothetical protein [Nonomuraea jabiensis]MBB5773684.1 hypothetical protein [Nonomuraea jabiensis]